MKQSKTPTVIAVTALVVAALAATPIGQAAGRFVLAKGSVGTAQLKKNAVTTAKVKNHSLLAADFKTGQLPAGPQGAKGDKGESGSTGPAGISGRELVFGPFTTVAAGAYGDAEVSCPAGKKPIGGGWHGAADLAIRESYSPVGSPIWTVNAKNIGGSPGSFQAFAVCAFIS